MQDSSTLIKPFILPSIIKNDNRLHYGARLLYGDISELSRETGYCKTSDKEFSQVYKVSINTIQRWRQQLLKAGYIKQEIIHIAEWTDYMGHIVTTECRKTPLVRIPMSYY